MSLKKNLIKYRLIEKHIETVKNGDYATARQLLYLLRKKCIHTGLGNDAQYRAEIIAEECGCRIRYSRNYNVAEIRW